MIASSLNENFILSKAPATFRTKKYPLLYGILLQETSVNLIYNVEYIRLNLNLWTYRYSCRGRRGQKIQM